MLGDCVATFLSEPPLAPLALSASIALPAAVCWNGFDGSTATVAGVSSAAGAAGGAVAVAVAAASAGGRVLLASAGIAAASSPASSDLAAPPEAPAA